MEAMGEKGGGKFVLSEKFAKGGRCIVGVGISMGSFGVDWGAAVFVDPLLETSGSLLLGCFAGFDFEGKGFLYNQVELGGAGGAGVGKMVKKGLSSHKR